MMIRRFSLSLAWIAAAFAMLFVVAVFFGPRVLLGLFAVIVLAQLFRRR